MAASDDRQTIDHLGNRRVRGGRLSSWTNQYRVWPACAWSAAIRGAACRSVVNRHRWWRAGRPGSTPSRQAAAVRELFGSSQLSVSSWIRPNPLSEISHIRRLSALGPGGLHPRAGGLRGARRADPTRLRPPIWPIADPRQDRTWRLDHYSLAPRERRGSTGTVSAAESPYPQGRRTARFSEDVVYLSAMGDAGKYTTSVPTSELRAG